MQIRYTLQQKWVEVYENSSIITKTYYVHQNAYMHNKLVRMKECRMAECDTISIILCIHKIANNDTNL